MGWADFAKKALRAGQRTQVRPRGHSMTGLVEDGELVELEPTLGSELQVGDVVLVRVKGRDYLHLIKAINGGRCLIGNNRGGINGWVGASSIYGRKVKG